MDVDNCQAELASFKELLVLNATTYNDAADTVAANLTDRDCMRFLRARKMNVEKAVEMANNWWVWYNTPVQGSR